MDGTISRQAGPWLHKKTAEHEPGSQLLARVPPWPLHWVCCANLPPILFPFPSWHPREGWGGADFVSVLFPMVCGIQVMSVVE